MDNIETDALLDDTGELDSYPEAIAASLEQTGSATVAIGESVAFIDVADEPPVHRVQCMVDGCQAGATYHANVTGTGFVILDRIGMDLETALGVGPNGRPICPFEEHGEMTLADEQLPVAEAFANAQAALQACEGGPVQGDLPGILPAFNFKGCYLELEEKAAEVNRLHEDYLEKKEEATDAKKLWDKAAELYTKMALEFRRRRQAKGEPGPSVTDPVSRALVCVWDKAHPDDACPLCAAASITERTVIVRALGAEILPGDAQAHAEQVVAYRAWLDVQDTVEALAEVIFDIPEETIAGWSGEERAAVRAWKRDNRLPMPVVLGRPHIAASVEDGAKVQTCATCGAVIKQLDDVKEAYWSGDLVRTDCAGAEPDGHHYPERKPKPTSRRKSVADTAEHVVDAGAKVSIRKKPAAKGAKKKGARS